MLFVMNKAHDLLANCSYFTFQSFGFCNSDLLHDNHHNKRRKYHHFNLNQKHYHITIQIKDYSIIYFCFTLIKTLSKRHIHVWIRFRHYNNHDYVWLTFIFVLIKLLNFFTPRNNPSSRFG